MLVLSRKKNEVIRVKIGGKALDIIIVEIRGDKARLGFDGPEDFIIVRLEEGREVTKRPKTDEYEDWYNKQVAGKEKGI